jgi:large subunit ribosomal protein L21
MYAIVKTGGKQYRVERGQTLLVERLAVDEGSSVALEPILYRSDDAVFDAAGLKKVKVTAKIVAHERGEKLRVFKFKPKRGYKRRTGHRQELTRIEVTDISMAGASSKATAPKTASKPVAARSHDEPAAEAAEAATKAPKDSSKPAAAKPPTNVKPAAAKPAAERSPTNTNPAAAAGGGEVQEVSNGS